MKNAIITFESMTYGIKAKKALAVNGINSKLIKLSSDTPSSGCVYGLDMDYKNFFLAKKILKEANSPFTQG